MRFPVQVGWPQVVLLLIGLVGLALLVSSVIGLRPSLQRAGADPTAPGARTAGAGVSPLRARLARLRQVRLRPRLRIRRGASGGAMLVVAVSLLWFTALVQSYLGLTGEIRAAHVTALPISNAPHTLSVELTLYDDDGHAETPRVYQVEGDRWVLQANIMELNHWVNVLGVHSGYKVTRLFGEYDDGQSPKQHHIFLNGGDDDFFTSMRDRAWWTKPFVRSAYGNAVIASPGDYDVYVSQDAIKARPTKD